MGGSQKKVIVRLVSGQTCAGYLPPRDFVRSGVVEMIDIGGVLKPFALTDIEMISYVVDFNRSEAFDPEQLGRRAFLARPRAPGLWVRVTLANGSMLEGLASLDLRFANELATDQGVFLTPPDPKSNAHRVFVPCASMGALEILAVIGANAAASAKRPGPAGRKQPSLFEDT